MKSMDKKTNEKKDKVETTTSQKIDEAKKEFLI